VTNKTSSEAPRAIHDILAVGNDVDPISTAWGISLALMILYNKPACVPTNKLVDPSGLYLLLVTAEKATLELVPISII
jgi:hypothetical protein